MTHHQPQLGHQQRLLALDPGGHRTGVAVSDELGLFAHARAAIVADSPGETARQVQQIVGDDNVSEVIVGMPLSMSGLSSGQADEASVLVRVLRERLAVPVTTWDERLSSVQASRPLRGATKGEEMSPDRPGKGRRKSGESDSRSAAIVLQAVLDSRRGARR